MNIDDAVDSIFVCIISCVIFSITFIYNATRFSSALVGLIILFAMLITIFVCYTVVRFELNSKKKKRWK